MRGLEAEAVLPHSPGGEGVAAGELLHQPLVEAGALLALAGDRQAGAEEVGDAGEVTAVADEHHLRVDGDGVLADDLLDRLHERGLAVDTAAVQDGQDVLAQLAEQRRAHEPPHELADLLVG